MIGDVHTRVVEVLRAVSGRGSGYAVAADLVLTAAHVVGDEETVRVIAQDGELQGRVVWRHPTLDAALVRVGKPRWEGVITQWALLSGIRPVPCTAIGYPRVQKTGDDIRVEEHTAGFIMPHTGQRIGRYAVNITSALPYDLDRGSSPWSGLSGAALLTVDGRYVLGVLVDDPTGFEASRLEAVPVADLLANPGFAGLVDAGPASLVRLSGEPNTANPACDCGTFAIGHCAECGRSVCADHSSTFAGRRLCEIDGAVESQRIAEKMHRIAEDAEAVWRAKIGRLAALRPEAAAQLEPIGEIYGKQNMMQQLDWALQEAEEARNGSSQPVSSPQTTAPRSKHPTYASAEEALQARVAADRTAREQEDRQRRAKVGASVAAELPAFRTLLADTLEHLARANYPGGELLYFDAGWSWRRRPKAAWLLFTRQGAWARDGYLTDRYYLLASGEIWGFLGGQTVKIKLAELTLEDLAEARSSLLQIRSLTD